MGIAQTVATHSTCNRGVELKYRPGRYGVRAVIVRDRVIFLTGYNGSPRGMKHCDEIGHQIVDSHCIRTVHSEANTIAQVTKNGAQSTELHFILLPHHVTTVSSC